MPICHLPMPPFSLSLSLPVFSIIRNYKLKLKCALYCSFERDDHPFVANEI